MCEKHGAPPPAFEEKSGFVVVTFRDPAQLDWNEVTKVAHYDLAANAMTKPMQAGEDSPPHGGKS